MPASKTFHRKSQVRRKPCPLCMPVGSRRLSRVLCRMKSRPPAAIALCVPDPAQPVDTEQFFFDRGSKCCTYTPTLANFMVGALLGDSAPSMATGRATLAARLRQRPRCRPAGRPSPACLQSALPAQPKRLRPQQHASMSAPRHGRGRRAPSGRTGTLPASPGSVSTTAGKSANHSGRPC